MENGLLCGRVHRFRKLHRISHQPILARLIRNREITDEEEIRLYLNGTIAELHDGILMKDMDRAVEILSEKIREKKPIRVIGDYDIDGVNATYILLEGIEKLGGVVDSDIPDRMKDGYGLNQELINRALEAGSTRSSLVIMELRRQKRLPMRRRWG